MPDDAARGRDDIAVIGMAGRFPGAGSVKDFWRNLRDGVESITFFSDTEVRAAILSNEDPGDPDYVKAGAVLDGIELFDAPFFGMGARDAEITDPQRRLLLECAWEALESAGYDPAQHRGLIGVFAGSAANAYLLNNIIWNPAVYRALDPYQLVISSDKDYLATYVSYALDLRGPSLTVQTACSSSLVATHLARQSLLAGECDLALAGGVSLRVPQEEGHLYRPGGLVSPDGHTRTFDARAAGTLFGSGLGVIALKRLRDALADGDHIRAVIKGTAVNNDGATKTGYTAPSLPGQVAVLTQALEAAGIGPETLTYVEAHGTATLTGDPVEVAALTRVFRARTEKTGFCAIGTVKTNVGHLNAAAGVAGLIKTILSLEHRQLPPSLHFERPNPAIRFPETPFYVNRALADWRPAAGAPRRAAVNSLGIGGTNASAILEEAPEPPPGGASRPWQLLTLAARSAAALDAASANLAAHLEQHPETNLADACYTLKVGRRAFRHRRMVTCCTATEAVEALRGQRPERVLSGVVEPPQRPVVFMFPGQASEHVHMAEGLYQDEPAFRETMDFCADFLTPLLEMDLRSILYPAAGAEEAAARQLARPLVSQAALFVITYALAKLWMSWGIRPATVVGYSTGELTAGCVAGVFSLEDGLRIVAARGRLIESVPAGAMMAVALPEDEVLPHVGPGLSLAAVSGPSHCVVAGPPERVEALAAKLKGLRVPCRRLPVSRAFHSEALDPNLPKLHDAVAQATLRQPSIRFASTVTGTWASEVLATPEYWVRQTRDPVHFYQAARPLVDDEPSILLEVGPGQALTDMVRRFTPVAARSVLLPTCRHIQSPQHDAEFLLNTLGKLWLLGAPVDWSAFYAREHRRRVPLPTYPFERRRYWVEPQPLAAAAKAPFAAQGKRADISDWFYVPSWKRLPLCPTPMERTPGTAPARWLIFRDGCGLGDALAARLQQMGHEVATVTPAEAFARVGDRAYALNPQWPDDCAALLRELASEGGIPTDVVHLWTVAPPRPAESDAERFDRLQDLGYYSLLALASALAHQAVGKPVRLHVVTAGMQAVTGAEALCPETATVVGPCKVIPQEYPNVACRSVDIELPGATPTQVEALAEQLLAEVTSTAAERVVACRGPYRWVEVFEPLRLAEPPREGGLLRRGGVYLITGGLGEIGLALAEHLARTAGARLALVGRSGLPPRDEWAAWLSAHRPDDRVSRRIRGVQGIERLGGEVAVLAADVADEAQMRDAVAQARGRFGAVHGVFHAAGVLDDSAFADIPRVTRRGSEAHFAPKAHGLRALERVLRDEPLDFCLLFSSISTVLGGLGYTPYVAANAFMDAFVHQHNRASATPWTSVDWDAWTLRADDAAARTGMARFALTGLEGAAALERVLSARGIGRLVVSTGDLHDRIAQWAAGRPSAGAPAEAGQGPAATPAEGPGGRHPRPELPNAYVAPEDDVQEAVAGVWRELLGVEQVGIHDNFFELGGHSLLATQVISRLRRALRVELPVGVLFGAPTIAELADRVRELRSGGVETNGSDRVLREIEGLREEEARKLLADDKSGGPPGAEG